MVDPTSPLAEYYPKDFECDANGKKNSWETVVKIPFIDQKQLFDALSTIDHEKDLEPMDRLRNAEGKVWQFLPKFRVTSSGKEPRKPPPQPSKPAGRGRGRGVSKIAQAKLASELQKDNKSP
ncbi:unnamed protein product [Sphacelaria rigidula]